MSKEYPEGDVAVQRRNKKTKLVDVVVLGKKQSVSGVEEEENNSVKAVPNSQKAAVPKSKAIPKVKVVSTEVIVDECSLM